MKNKLLLLTLMCCSFKVFGSGGPAHHKWGHGPKCATTYSTQSSLMANPTERIKVLGQCVKACTKEGASGAAQAIACKTNLCGYTKIVDGTQLLAQNVVKRLASPSKKGGHHHMHIPHAHIPHHHDKGSPPGGKKPKPAGHKHRWGTQEALTPADIAAINAFCAS